MTSFLVRLVAITTLGLAATITHAATYNVHEIFKGAFTETSLGGDNFSSAYNYSLDSLIAGDSSLFAVSQGVNYANKFWTYDPGVNLLLREGIGNFTQTLLNGDTLFGILSPASILNDPEVVIVPRPNIAGGIYNDFTTLMFVTGGTGLFAGAIGIGEFAQVDTYLTATSGTSELGMAFNFTTPDVAPPNPVPLPAAAWLFGTVLLGFAGIRRKSSI